MLTGFARYDEGRCEAMASVQAAAQAWKVCVSKILSRCAKRAAWQAWKSSGRHSVSQLTWIVASRTRAIKSARSSITVGFKFWLAASISLGRLPGTVPPTADKRRAAHPSPLAEHWPQRARAGRLASHLAWASLASASATFSRLTYPQVFSGSQTQSKLVRQPWHPRSIPTGRPADRVQRHPRRCGRQRVVRRGS
jgi:hypothetical protein